MRDDPWNQREEWQGRGALIDGKVMTSSISKHEFDVVVIGSGAGGAMAAQQLARAGASVLLLESGNLYTAKDFTGSESLYLKLYKNGLLNSTLDGGINLLQGHCVGGSATVNWTSSFRLPEQTRRCWESSFGASHLSARRLSEEFESIESLLSVAPWPGRPNENNQLLAKGARTLGWHHGVIPRNVKGCWNLGFCGVGCPVNAKQSPLVTTIPDAIKSGATLMYNSAVSRLLYEGSKIYGAVLGNGMSVRGRHFMLAAGAIQSPGILLRSGLSGMLPAAGKRTVIHPCCFSMARYSEVVDPFYGAPQSIYSDEFLWGAENCSESHLMGFKLESVPLQPVLASGIFAQSGASLAEDMSKLANTQGMTALLRDGFGESVGGEVLLVGDGAARLHYPQSQYLVQSAKRALLKMAECQFAAGALEVRPGHLVADRWFQDLNSLKIFIENAPYDKYHLSLGSAHLMGGCGLGQSRASSVVNDRGQVHDFIGLSVCDASVFPTSLGVNPQLTIMAMSSIIAKEVQKTLESVN